ncbi:UDP-2,3-diacylglucosamine diphosphatase [Legionella sp. W05-934-2]|uniref:UDP-2,3-diacylglucosamine diphosphatase n=1 Tax=Legionella sp. W05-934-2 TaxID=1198649 RepID=UPI003463311B
MNEAVFISDLHLNPDCPALTDQFIRFCHWAENNTKSVYILGDFFHLWVGDDDHSEWITPIRNALLALDKKGIKLFYMGGNRDFLLGKRFCRQSGMHYLKDGTLLNWQGNTIALTHGDRLCTKDRTHQLFYHFTRNAIFPFFFNRFPFKFRRALAKRVRQRSQRNKPKQRMLGAVTIDGINKFIHRYPCDMVVHGHTHQPALHHHVVGKQVVQRFVLSDWDDKVIILCYHNAKGFYFYQFEVSHGQR